MSFSADYPAILKYAGKLGEIYEDEMWGKNYVHQHGEFSLHEKGLIGLLSSGHESWMAQLDQMFGDLLTVTLQSSDALREIAVQYQETDEKTAARVDASYPVVPRPVVNRD